MLQTAASLRARWRWLIVLRALFLCAWWRDAERAIAHAGAERLVRPRRLV